MVTVGGQKVAPSMQRTCIPVTNLRRVAPQKFILFPTNVTVPWGPSRALWECVSFLLIQPTSLIHLLAGACCPLVPTGPWDETGEKEADVVQPPRDPAWALVEETVQMLNLNEGVPSCWGTLEWLLVSGLPPLPSAPPSRLCFTHHPSAWTHGPSYSL